MMLKALVLLSTLAYVAADGHLSTTPKDGHFKCFFCNTGSNCADYQSVDYSEIEECELGCRVNAYPLYGMVDASRGCIHQYDSDFEGCYADYCNGYDVNMRTSSADSAKPFLLLLAASSLVWMTSFSQ
ncbi:hypothetical protein CAPTEDRAFT_211414 [Capitella teleta]|uniref:UPAR/Ly6 domain-containing protein n=1 Tax=Capitella teleta TaxID=283909 RepID=R7TG42_CAPTE|nr:hypothetical protein CAPTEDRAFT_213728 [Capitella teleta]ELT97228.1 hypothetical protein CAPTEDRAFT_211414 [Capitella teleta]|eukprot:ELT92753.1 hypothetical protein CAPTEDRAFT_213728 [Capitella teleta]